MSHTDLALPTTSFPADFAPDADRAPPAAAARISHFHLTPAARRAERAGWTGSAAAGTSMLQVVLAAAAVALLGRYTRADEVSLGLPGGVVLRTDPTGTCVSCSAGWRRRRGKPRRRPG